MCKRRDFLIAILLLLLFARSPVASEANLTRETLVGKWAFGSENCQSEAFQFFADETYFAPGSSTRSWYELVIFADQIRGIQLQDPEQGTTVDWFIDPKKSGPDTLVLQIDKRVLVRCPE